MKVLVCGDRDFYDWRLLEHTLYEFNKDEAYDTGITEIIHGDAQGADRLAGQWAVYQNINISKFPANWEVYGKRAGSIRNKQMLDLGNPEYVIAFLAPNSIGTKNMIEQATKAGVQVKVINV